MTAASARWSTKNHRPRGAGTRPRSGAAGYPFAGSRMLRDLLRGEGIVIGQELVAAMMRRMGIDAPYLRPNTSKSTHAGVKKLRRTNGAR